MDAVITAPSGTNAAIAPQDSFAYEHQRYSSSNYSCSSYDSLDDSDDILPSTVTAARFSTLSSNSFQVPRKPLPRNAAPLIPSTFPAIPSIPTEGNFRSDFGTFFQSQGEPPPSVTRQGLAPSNEHGQAFFDLGNLNTISRFSLGKGQGWCLRIDRFGSFSPFENGGAPDYGDKFANGPPAHSRSASESVIQIVKPPPRLHKRANTMALHPHSKRPPPLQLDSKAKGGSGGSTDSKLPPKTPANKITSFFGWKTAQSPGAESSTTDISDYVNSPLHSGMPPLLHSAIFPTTQPTTASTDYVRGNGVAVHHGNGSTGGLVVQNPGLTSKITELENELREISSELAGSIRREMELEELVERLQSEILLDANRRTSDYFSDSGTSSGRYGSDATNRTEDIEKMKRAAEQERALLKADLSQKLQEERARRTASESHVQILESQVKQLRQEKVDATDIHQKNRELEIALDDTRRRLSEERQLKDNFEDLLTAMRVELEQLRRDRDNLRDEVIPQLEQRLDNVVPSKLDPAQIQKLQAKIEALKSENASLVTQMRKIENAQIERVVPSEPDEPEIQKLHSEIEALKFENASLAQMQANRFATIAEEESQPMRRISAFGLSRSNSLVRAPAKSSGLSRSASLSRSNSQSQRQRESPESLADRMKNVEAQRDALHQALKSLLDRQAYQARENDKRIRILKLELEHAQSLGFPRKLGYEREVYNLREEVNHLRQRADEALEQKWQCEKGLAGLKMDLDRAEQETASLRLLLQEHDITPPPAYTIDYEDDAEVQAISSSLKAAYEQLQADRKSMEASVDSTEEHVATSVTRATALANDVHKQLETNTLLRSRLSEAIGRGEREQQLSAARINELQNRLRELEDVLIAAQHHAEEEMAKHEEDIRSLKESHNAQLRRMKFGTRSPVALSPKPPSSPFGGTRSPRLDWTTSGDGLPLTKVVQTETLEKRVKELEKALRDADLEMEEVVSRMNRAQIEVAELQADRDEALRRTQKLQAKMLTEREAFKAFMG